MLFLCPNYNDAVSANLMALFNRMTNLLVQHTLYDKYLFGIVVSGYSGGDLVAQRLLGTMCFNKTAILPGRFCLMQTAHDPGSVRKVSGIGRRMAQFAQHMVTVLQAWYAQPQARGRRGDPPAAPPALRDPGRAIGAHTLEAGGDQPTSSWRASYPVSPVRTFTASSTEVTKILPSPAYRCAGACLAVSITRSGGMLETTTDTCTVGRRAMDIGTHGTCRCPLAGRRTHGAGHRHAGDADGLQALLEFLKPIGWAIDVHLREFGRLLPLRQVGTFGQGQGAGIAVVELPCHAEGKGEVGIGRGQAVLGGVQALDLFLFPLPAWCRHEPERSA